VSDTTDDQIQDQNMDNHDDNSSVKTFTQEEVNQILEQRLARERKRFEKQTAGIDLDEAKRALEEKQAAELEAAKQRGEFEKVLKSTVEKKDQTIQSLQQRLHQIQVDGALLNAASSQNAVSPDQVSALLRNQIRLGEDGNVEVLDTNGAVRYNDKGELLSVNQLMSEFLTANPHFVRATPGGSGSTGGAGGSTQKPMSVAAMLENWDSGGREAFAAQRKRK
jgi:hypothetical protein